MTLRAQSGESPVASALTPGYWELRPPDAVAGVVACLWIRVCDRPAREVVEIIAEKIGPVIFRDGFQREPEREGHTPIPDVSCVARRDSARSDRLGLPSAISQPRQSAVFVTA